MKPRPRPPTIITRVIVFLLLGAIVNVAVAWGCAIWINEKTRETSLEPELEPELVTRRWAQFCQDDWPSAPQTLMPPEISYARRTEIIMRSISTGLTIDTMGVFDQSVTTGAWTSWQIVHVSCGWPFQSLQGDWSKSGGVVSYHSTIEIGLPRFAIRNSLAATRLIAYSPLWPGFAINTIFYAAILGLLFFAPGSVRRTIRRRRGLCPACAYPIGTSPVCTECGTKLPLPLPSKGEGNDRP